MNRPGSGPDWFWIVNGTGLGVRVRLSPKGSRDQIEGIVTLADGRQVLAVRVRAVPARGLANAALEKLIARAIGVAPGRVAVTVGKKDRIKTVTVAGDSVELINAFLALPADQK